MRHSILFLFGVSVASGCIGIGLPIDGPPPDGDGIIDGNGDDEAPFAVSLAVSNPTPQVGEEVFLACDVISGDDEGVTFAFQPSGRLQVDPAQGLARLIVQESDAGQVFSLTCTARNAAGQTATSDPRTVAPNL